MGEESGAGEIAFMLGEDFVSLHRQTAQPPSKKNLLLRLEQSEVTLVGEGVRLCFNWEEGTEPRCTLHRVPEEEDVPCDSAWCAVSADYLVLAENGFVPSVKHVRPFIDFYAQVKETGEVVSVTAGSEETLEVTLMRKVACSRVVFETNEPFARTAIALSDKTFSSLLRALEGLVDFVFSCSLSDRPPAKRRCVRPVAVEDEEEDED